MKKILVLTVLAFTAFFASANNYRDDDDHYKFEVKKNIEKTFDVEAEPTLEMTGKYSDFIITSWDKQQIEFKVKVIVKGNDAKKVDAKLNSIDIEFEQVGNKIKVETVFDDYPYKNFIGSSTIKFYVKVPEDVFMELNTKYGDITVETVKKRFEVDIKYGDLTADNLLAESYLDIKYGNIDINKANKIDLELDYGDARIKKCDYIDGVLKYSKIFIADLGNGTLENKYSSSRIEKVDKIQFPNTAYSNLKVSNVTDMIEVEMKYSDLKATISSESPKVDIDGQYSDAMIYLNENASFNYHLKSAYADITFKGFFETRTLKESGSYGDGEPGRLDISTRYGDMKIYKSN